MSSSRKPPEFTLKAADAFAVEVITLWIMRAEFWKVDPGKIESARKVRAEFLEWRRKYGTKLPD